MLSSWRRGPRLSRLCHESSTLASATAPPQSSRAVARYTEISPERTSSACSTALSRMGSLFTPSPIHEGRVHREVLDPFRLGQAVRSAQRSEILAAGEPLERLPVGAGVDEHDPVVASEA